MKKPVRSAKAPADNKAGQGAPELSGPASRQEVRQDTHRTNVPRQSQRPAERSNQRRSGKP